MKRQLPQLPARASSQIRTFQTGQGTVGERVADRRWQQGANEQFCSGAFIYSRSGSGRASPGLQHGGNTQTTDFQSSGGGGGKWMVIKEFLLLSLGLADTRGVEDARNGPPNMRASLVGKARGRETQKGAFRARGFTK